MCNLKQKSLLALSVLGTIWHEPSNKGQRLYRVILSCCWQLWKRTVGLPIIIRLDNGTLFIAEPLSGNSVGAIYTCVYESKYILFVRKHVIRGGTLCDIGAHAGLYTLLLWPLFKSGLCFEPADDTFQLLLRNLGLNQVNQFKAFKEAVSSTCGEVEFQYGDYAGQAHILQKGESTQKLTKKISCTTLDSRFYYTGIKDLTYLKIDTEGHEFEVLKGAYLTLQENPQALVQFENNTLMEPISQFFLDLGWKVFGIDSKGNPTCSRSIMEQEYNLLACGSGHPLFSSL